MTLRATRKAAPVNFSMACAAIGVGLLAWALHRAAEQEPR